MQHRFITLIVAILLPIGLQAAQIAYSVGSDSATQNDFLFRINVVTGVEVAIGDTGFEDVEGLAFHPTTGVLYGVDDATDQLITIDRNTGIGTAVGFIGIALFDVGLTFDSSGNLWLVDEESSQQLISVNTLTGAGTSIGSLGTDLTGLAALGDTLFGIDDDGPDRLVTVNPVTGLATTVGSLGFDMADDGGLAFDSAGTLWGIDDASGQIFTINTATGQATLISSTRSGFESLAFATTPEPASIGLFGLGLLVAGWMRRKNAAKA